MWPLTEWALGHQCKLINVKSDTIEILLVVSLFGDEVVSSIVDAADSLDGPSGISVGAASSSSSTGSGNS